MTVGDSIPLVDLLNDSGVKALDIRGDVSRAMSGISLHAQRTRSGEAFVATRGTNLDSHLYISEAIDAGASVIFVDREIGAHSDVTVVQVEDTRQALGYLAHAFYGNPSRSMKVCGVTGTNGKTSVTSLVNDILIANGTKSGLIGTIGTKYGTTMEPASTTTPSGVELAALFRRMADDRVTHVVMEVSSHGIDQGRINGIPFHVGAFTNISHDHLDYHGTLENYAACKARLIHDFVARSNGVGVLNLDDPIVLDVYTNSLGDKIGFSNEGHGKARVACGKVEFTQKGTNYELILDGKNYPVASRLVGHFNLSNMLAAAGCAYSLGVEPGAVARGLELARPVAGRMEYVDEGQPFSVIVDYAHTPDALERALATARRHCQNRLITVFGCGGDRDRSKRPEMGMAAGAYSDFVVLTSDNPRLEDPMQIAEEAAVGLRHSRLSNSSYHTVLDREEAIELAINVAGPGDVVIIAGKGHEDYQDIGVKKLPFDDRQIARKVLRSLRGQFNQQPEIQIDRGIYT